jgi:hypothetical protein
MGIVFEKLEDRMHDFLPWSVSKQRKGPPNQFFIGLLLSALYLVSGVAVQVFCGWAQSIADGPRTSTKKGFF